MAWDGLGWLGWVGRVAGAWGMVHFWDGYTDVGRFS